MARFTKALFWQVVATRAATLICRLTKQYEKNLDVIAYLGGSDVRPGSDRGADRQL